MEDFMRSQFDSVLITPYLGRASDIANATVFLASDDARYITGQILSVDGGLLAHQPMVTYKGMP
jgi:NAD(P)-dependent dehydrogenase (short-subunit alcohol dehydrogenase family)